MGKRVLRKSRWGTKRVDELTQEDIKKALEVFGKRPSRSQKIDKRYAGKVPAFFETWLRHPERYDLPGVDLGTERRSSKKKIQRKGVTGSETSSSFKTEKPASEAKKKTYKATVTVGYSCTRSGRCTYYSVFLVSRDGKVLSLKEAESRGIVKPEGKIEWYVSRSKKYGDLAIEVPEDWFVIQRLSGDVERVEVYGPNGIEYSPDKKVGVKPYRKVVHVKVAKGRKVVDIVEEGFRVGGLLISTYFRLKDREYDYPLSLFDGRIVEECSSLKECKNLVIKRKVRKVVGEGRTVVADLRKGLKVFTVNLPKGYKAVVVVGNTYPIRNELKSLGMRFSRDVVKSVGEYMKRFMGYLEDDAVAFVGRKVFDLYRRRLERSGVLRRLSIDNAKLYVPGGLIADKASLEDILKMGKRFYKAILKGYERSGRPLDRGERFVLYYETVVEPLMKALDYAGIKIPETRINLVTVPVGFWVSPVDEFDKKILEEELKKPGTIIVGIKEKGKEKKYVVEKRHLRYGRAMIYPTGIGWYRVFTPADIKAGEYEEFKKGLRKLFRGGGK